MAALKVSRPLPILRDDIPRVSAFLHGHLNRRVSISSWSRAVDSSQGSVVPNHGFMLTAENRVVGAYIAIYSERKIAGKIEYFCNLAAWCVLPEFRFHSIRLLQSLLAQPGYHFTDLSPSGNTIPINRRLTFKELDTTSFIIPGLPWPWLPGKTAVYSDPTTIAARLGNSDLKIFLEHRHAPAARHLLLVHGASSCYIIFRRERRFRMRHFATLLYVSNPDLFRSMTRHLGRHLLLHHMILATFAERQVTNLRSWPTLLTRPGRPKMFRSYSLEPGAIDYLYSELTALEW